MALVIMGAMVASSSCTLDASGRTACVEDEDCSNGRSCVLERCLDDALWGCLDTATADPPVLQTLRLLVGDETTDMPVAGAQLRVCERLDVACAFPHATLITNDEGIVELELEDQYVEIEAAGYVPRLTMGADSFELLEDGVTVAFDMWLSATVDDLVREGGITLDPARGMIEATTLDCGLEPASDISVALDAQDATTLVRYPINDVLSTTAIATDLETASALAFNVQPGSRSISGTVLVRNRPIGGLRSVLVRPGWFSHVTLAPDGLGLDDLRAP